MVECAVRRCLENAVTSSGFFSRAATSACERSCTAAYQCDIEPMTLFGKTAHSKPAHHSGLLWRMRSQKG